MQTKHDPRQWVLYDIKTEESEDSEFSSTNYVVVHVKFFIEDSYGINCFGHYRISTPLLEILIPCVFTRNSAYILTGSGSRKTANSKDVDALYL